MTYPTSEPPVPPVFLHRPPEPREPTAEERVSRPARWFRLDTFGRSLLSRRAAYEMNRTGVVLLVIFAFESFLWAAVFNSVFYADIGIIGGWTPIAVLLGLVYGALVVFFDQSFVVMDTTTPAKALGWAHLRIPSWLLPAFFRGFVIVVSVVAAAGVLDLILFAQPIDRRIEEENLRWYLVAFSRELEKPPLTNDEVAPGTAKDEHFTKKVKEIDRKTEEKTTLKLNVAGRASRLLQKINLAEGEIETARKGISRLESARRIRRLSSPGADLSSLDREILDLRTKVQDLQQQSTEDAAARGRALGQVKTLEGEINDLDTERQNVERQQLDFAVKEDEEVREANADQTAIQDRVKAWVDRYRLVSDKKPLIQKLPVPGAEDGNNHPPRRDVFERYRVLRDLKHGWPPSWPATSDAKIARLKQEFALGDPPLCDDSSLDAVPPGHCRSAWTYTRGYWLLFLIAGVVPSMALASKLLLSSSDTKTYYSLVSQARAGNGDALDQLASRP